ncbi:MAG: HNH endonuclease signature motif containing protein [Candidatus Competibacteraceae bacterium]
MNPHYIQIALRAGHRCEYCHAPEAVFNFPFEVEHIIPVSHGGCDAESNWALACRSCNLRKATHISGIDPLSQTAVRLFQPREDRWEEHFRVNTESGEIEGLTAVGRATIARLEINSKAQKEARRQWTRFGLFP